MTINERVALVIKKLELNNNSFSNKIGVNPTIIHNIIKGRNSPSYDVLNKIALTFWNEINPQWLLTGKGEILREGEWYIVKNTTKSKSKEINFSDSNNKKVSDILLKEIEMNIRELRFMYQRIIDVRILLNEQLKTKEADSTKESEILHNIEKMEYATFGVSYIETLTYDEAIQYNKSIIESLSVFRSTFFDLFKKLYQGLRKPIFDEIINGKNKKVRVKK